MCWPPAVQEVDVNNFPRKWEKDLSGEQKTNKLVSMFKKETLSYYEN